MGCYEYSVSTSLSDKKVFGLSVTNSGILLPENAIGKTVSIFTLSGVEIEKFTAQNRACVFNHQGVFIVRLGSDNYKIIK